jgi:hypothetical protein
MTRSRHATTFHRTIKTGSGPRSNRGRFRSGSCACRHTPPDRRQCDLFFYGLINLAKALIALARRRYAATVQLKASKFPAILRATAGKQILTMLQAHRPLGATLSPVNSAVSFVPAGHSQVAIALPLT